MTVKEMTTGFSNSALLSLLIYVVGMCMYDDSTNYDEALKLFSFLLLCIFITIICAISSTFEIIIISSHSFLFFFFMKLNQEFIRVERLEALHKNRKREKK